MHSCPDGSTVSRYDTYKQVEKARGSCIELVNAPRLPGECQEAWRLFSQMPQVSYTEIKSYMELTGDTIAAWEIDLIIGFELVRRSEPKWQK